MFENPTKSLIQRPVTFKILPNTNQMIMIMMKFFFQDQFAFSLFSILSENGQIDG